MKRAAVASMFAGFALVLPVQAKTICTVIADADTGAIVLQQGDCATRVTPASTFKIALSLIAFDQAILRDTHDPVLPFQQGYPDWGGVEWQQPTDAARWMKHSVVWFSQQLTKALGTAVLERYATDFGYGNADFSGDKGYENGLERAWISSSLQISPLEQAAFLAKLVSGELPVSAHAIAMTQAIIERSPADGGWQIFGKTGTAFPRNADRSFDRSHGWGWFVGWARQGERTLVFARLDQDEERHSQSGGLRARDQLLDDWARLAAGLPQ